jgi:hypothetical protein
MSGKANFSRQQSKLLHGRCQSRCKNLYLSSDLTITVQDAPRRPRHAMQCSNTVDVD